MFCVASFDVGILNFAFTVLCITANQAPKVLVWRNVCLGSSKSSLSNIIQMMVRLLEKEEHLADVSKVVIERQPPNNVKLRALSHAIETYFLTRTAITPSKHTDVFFFDARSKSKLQVEGIPAVDLSCNYRQRKQRSIEYARDIVEAYFPGWSDMFSKSSKQDDLADCFIQALAFVQTTTDLCLTGTEPPQK